MARRGNPKWGSPVLKSIPVLPSEFEMVVRRLKLKPEHYATSDELRSWCVKNRNRCYVPEWLLEEWEIETDSNMV